MFCIVKDGTAHEGSYEEIAMRVIPYEIDYQTRTVYLRGIGPDTISYSAQWTDEELRYEVARRVISLILAQGWRLYAPRNYV